MVETAEAKQVSQAASSLLFPQLEFGVADNGTYPSEDFQRVLARIAFDNEFANAGAKAHLAADSGQYARVSTPLSTGKTARTVLVEGSYPVNTSCVLHPAALVQREADSVTSPQQFLRLNPQLL